MTSPQLDHTHDGSNTFRGWLCASCNRGIGGLGDDVAGVLNALVYLINSTQPTNANETTR